MNMAANHADEFDDGDFDTDMDYNVSFSMQSMDIRSIVGRFREGSIYVPEYQRNKVWKANKVTALINTILSELPTPSLILCEEDDGRLSIIDGQQRISAVEDFTRGRPEYSTTPWRPFRLGTGVHSNYRSKCYADLPELIQRKIMNYNLFFILIRKKDPKIDIVESVHRIYEIINTHGVPLSPHEIRNCVSSGMFQEKLRDLTSLDQIVHSFFVDDERMKRQEGILSILAMAHNLEAYNGRRRSFLNRFMYQNRHLTNESLILNVERLRQVAELVNKAQLNKYLYHVAVAKTGLGLPMKVYKQTMAESIFSALLVNWIDVQHMTSEELVNRMEDLITNPNFTTTFEQSSNWNNKTLVLQRYREAFKAFKK